MFTEKNEKKPSEFVAKASKAAKVGDLPQKLRLSTPETRQLQFQRARIEAKHAERQLRENIDGNPDMQSQIDAICRVINGSGGNGEKLFAIKNILASQFVPILKQEKEKARAASPDKAIPPNQYPQTQESFIRQLRR